MGYGKPAGHVASFVLAACALGSGSGCVLRGFIERAFPYCNLSNEHIFVSVYVDSHLQGRHLLTLDVS